jgi:NADH-quinone oxidoreductase subunit M
MVPLAAVALWMGVYPESFLAPMRGDVTTVVARLAPAKPAGDAHLAAGKAKPAAAHGEPAHGSSHAGGVQ